MKYDIKGPSIDVIIFFMICVLLNVGFIFFIFCQFFFSVCCRPVSNRQGDLFALGAMIESSILWWHRGMCEILIGDYIECHCQRSNRISIARPMPVMQPIGCSLSFSSSSSVFKWHGFRSEQKWDTIKSICIHLLCEAFWCTNSFSYENDWIGVLPNISMWFFLLWHNVFFRTIFYIAFEGSSWSLMTQNKPCLFLRIIR